MITIFEDSNSIEKIANPRKGLATTDNNRFIRFWVEVNLNKVGLNFKDAEIAKQSEKKWFPLNKGGGTREWYGLNLYLINWQNNGLDLKETIIQHYHGGSYTKEIRSEEYYFKDSITWSALTSGKPTFRYSDYGALFDSAGSSMFPLSQDSNYILGLLNSNVGYYILKLINPTLNYGAGTVSNFPLYNKRENDVVENLVSQNISISKQDWDAHETSWDFEENELVRLAKEGLGQITATVSGEVAMQYHSLELLVEEYKTYWTEQFLQLHANEEELNRQFIEIYGLEDELTPDVPPEEITILQQGELSFN